MVIYSLHCYITSLCKIVQEAKERAVRYKVDNGGSCSSRVRLFELRIVLSEYGVYTLSWLMMRSPVVASLIQAKTPLRIPQGG